MLKSRFFAIVAFLLALIILERLVGFGFGYLYNHSNELTIKKVRYSILHCNEDIIVLGSSRAQHHYISDSISKNTGLSCYNCGIGGQGLYFTEIQLHSILKRYTPKKIVLDIAPNVLIDVTSEVKVKLLLPYAKNDTFIYERIVANSNIERMKMLSSIYPYNSTFFSAFSSLFYYKKDDSKGYVAIDGSLMRNEKLLPSFTVNQIHTKWMSQLNGIVALCRKANVPLVLVVSPIYKRSLGDSTLIDIVKNYSKNHNLEFYDYSKLYEGKYYLFKDLVHLNKRGASLFSAEFSRSFSHKLIDVNNKLQ